MGIALAFASVFAMTLSVAMPSVPASDPSEPPLHEIARVRATTSFCRALLADAVDAVAIETENDVRLGASIEAMKTLDFDANRLVKYRSTRALSDRYVALRAATVDGIAKMRRFRDAASAAPDTAQRRSLTDFADALSGAIYRQKVLADDLGRFIAYADAHEPIDAETHDRLTFEGILSMSIANSAPGRPTSMDAFGSPRFSQPPGATNGAANPLDAVPPTLSMLAKDGATELAKRAAPIATDERAASVLIDPAFSKC